MSVLSWYVMVDEYITLSDSAEILGVSVSRVAGEIDAGHLHACCLEGPKGPLVRLKRAEVIRLTFDRSLPLARRQA